MSSHHHIRHLWNNEQIWSNESPKRQINLAYDGVVDKVLMSFHFDVTNYRGCILDPYQPVKINDKILEIPDLPSDRVRLKNVERSDIDVTKFVTASKAGENNKIVLNYLIKDRPLFKKPIGKLTLYFTIFWSDKKSESVTPIIMPPPPAPSKFCMNCGRSITCIDFKFCPYCGQLPPPGGVRPKKCPNCDDFIPPTARFCEKYGHTQPGASNM